MSRPVENIIALTVRRSRKKLRAQPALVSARSCPHLHVRNADKASAVSQAQKKEQEGESASLLAGIAVARSDALITAPASRRQQRRQYNPLACFDIRRLLQCTQQLRGAEGPQALTAEVAAMALALSPHHPH